MAHLDKLIDEFRLGLNRAKSSLKFSDKRVRRIAILYLFVGILHGILDPGISYIGIELLGIGWEANPIMRVPMQEGFLNFALIHVPLYLGLLVAYVGTVNIMRREFEKGKTTVYHLAIIGLTVLIIWGVWLNVRNILVLIEVSA